jgi:Domain of unknown function (DUF6471)
VIREGKEGLELKAANRLKAELKLKGVTYAQLVDKLTAIGVDDKEVNVRNKLSRGKFTAAFLLQCLNAIGSNAVKFRIMIYINKLRGLIIG